MSDREIINAKHPPKASEILKKEYPTIYDGYMAIMDEQLERNVGDVMFKKLKNQSHRNY